ncbi:MAG: glucose-1-phosphate cytidylyltransferase [Pelagibacteraceae bacterium]|nr:glucose-1-phosphate cytidylyltransferase [Pelagibacteraceae bacterium]
MKVVILAGGIGSRLSEESVVRPKPLIEIGGMPIIWHIMKIYSYYGFKDFIICCGYKGYLIKEFFSNYFLHSSDLTIDLENDKIIYHQKNNEPWKITLVDTGDNTSTGGRIKKIKKFITEENFCLTYGDGLSAVNIKKLVNFHIKNKKKGTLIAVKPQGRFGSLKLEGNKVEQFLEKSPGDGGWVNGGFFVLNKDIFNYIRSEKTIWEREPLERLSKNNQLISYKFNGFWYAMDTLKDKNYLENLWSSGKAPWKIWC